MSLTSGHPALLQTNTSLFVCPLLRTCPWLATGQPTDPVVAPQPKLSHEGALSRFVLISLLHFQHIQLFSPGLFSGMNKHQNFYGARVEFLFDRSAVYRSTVFGCARHCRGVLWCFPDYLLSQEPVPGLNPRNRQSFGAINHVHFPCLIWFCSNEKHARQSSIPG